ncbi:cytidyltransferase-related domain containing protein [Tritrichomonas foetus]|uniref:ethanolamine-phosphate cytidylyltransferase n=1 Tax=Tritrichomonas foetus TaxID=1144522 RepID=A0A1J4KJ61_9EUKA|nr:cytidyltransferase-related domain containing protein [Tritrichomonas foetus]|eukprot:OHT09868.1 cytidyltransferase-related domain containing protein [Tritrichomonas foetus]
MSKFHRVWCDGCFDLCHFGHFNFMRQARGLADELYVGVHNDGEVEHNKGKPVFTLEERMELVSACKWVTKAIPDAPYTTEIEWIDRYNCDAVVHGDDLVLNADGIDTYHEVKQHNRFTTVPRTKAISTTNLIGRMIRLPKSELPEGFDITQLESIAGTSTSLHTYIPTTHRIAQFSNRNEPKYGDKIVYCDGTFDLLHPGHVSFLKKAREMGDYLVVGVHDDPTMESLLCPAMPIMTLQERVLNVLAMKYVDDVIIGAPYIITKELMDQIEPHVVVEGSAPTRTNEEDAFRVPKELGIFQRIESDYPTMSAKDVVHRVINNFSIYAKRNQSKEQSQYEVHPENE